MLDALRQMMKEKLDPIKADIGGLNAEVTEIKEDARHTRVLIETHDEKFQLIHKAQAETVAEFG